MLRLRATAFPLHFHPRPRPHPPYYGTSPPPVDIPFSPLKRPLPLPSPFPPPRPHSLPPPLHPLAQYPPPPRSACPGVPTTGYPGGLKARTAREQWEQDPRKLLWNAVNGMLPKNKSREARLAKLKIFPEADHPFGDLPLVPYVPPVRALRDQGIGWPLPRGFEPVNPERYRFRVMTSPQLQLQATRGGGAGGAGARGDEARRPDVGIDDLLTEEERRLLAAAAAAPAVPAVPSSQPAAAGALPSAGAGRGGRARVGAAGADAPSPKAGGRGGKAPR